jgi:hypothetical protein
MISNEKKARSTSTSEAQLAVLMDIRDELTAANAELRRLNALLHRGNFSASRPSSIGSGGIQRCPARPPRSRAD